MTPDFFRAVHPFLPFTYGIDAMRETVGGFYGNHLPNLNIPPHEVRGRIEDAVPDVPAVPAPAPPELPLPPAPRIPGR